ncbi:phosphonate ABC transporter, permease protein PhnE [Paenibacillus senegalimassiliensis]|uniref:phosphonate ABC transporter, permease protein PhnE n=1 Tax=Paenibacillus senegalimassiliensis TaxID=1737426 RepID=UPI00073E9F59|nr:phosphonate ABC transporter, permease protein PhnE [Paenibacillus senegalimassiliensis]
MRNEIENADLALSTVNRWKTSLIVLLVAAIIIGAFILLEINPWSAFIAVPEFIAFFVNNFLPPNFDNINKYVPLIVDTILFAVVGTYISAVLGLLFGILLSEQTNRFAWLRFTVRFVLSFLRNVPVLAWAALLVYIFGIGNMVGLIALILATLGFLARSYSESINEIAGSKLEALKACGASYWQIIIHGLIPQFIPAWINWTLFSFEINMRASAILGMVGAGGIGIMIQTNMRLFKYHEALSLIIILAAMVLITEYCTNKLRKLIH